MRDLCLSDIESISVGLPYVDTIWNFSQLQEAIKKKEEEEEKERHERDMEMKKQREINQVLYCLVFNLLNISICQHLSLML